MTFDISPDGRRIAFSAVDTALYLLDLKTYHVTRLTQNQHCANPTFSPDGTKLVYSAAASGEKGSALYEMQLASKTTRRLTKDNTVCDFQPAYSPDGTRITFTRAFRYRRYSMGGMIWSDYDVCVMNADGTGLKRLTSKKYYSAARPHFTSNSKDIVFAAAVPFDGEFYKKDSGGSLTTVLQVSASIPGEPRIVLPLPKSVKQSGAYGNTPDLAPTGKQIAFISDRVTPFEYDICTMAPDGSHLRSLNITKISAYNDQPTYLPDGKSLLFLAGTETGEGNRPLFSLYQVNVDGSNPRMIADETLFLNPGTWKPRAPEPKNVRSVNAALVKGTPPEARDALGRTLLSRAVSRGDVASVQLLLQKGANPNTPDTDGSTVLTRALEKNNIEMVQLLLAKGAKVNAVPQGGELQGHSPLSLAVSTRNVRIVTLLLQAGADIRATDAMLGNTALHDACGSGNLAIVRLLLAKGSPVDPRNNLGITPLMEAASAGKLDVVKLLISKGANIRARDDQTRQLYGKAQFTGDTETAEKIRQSGKLNTLHEDGRSVLDWAHIGENAQVIAFLKKAGATE